MIEKHPITPDQQAFMQRAIDLARIHSQAGINGPFGAVIVRAGEIVGEGWNQVVEQQDPTAHAEVMAIRAAGRGLGTHVLDDCALYASCEPCPMCLAAIFWARIPVLYYACSRDDAAQAGFDDAAFYHEFALSPEQRILTTRQILREAGQAVFEAWAANPRRVMY